MSFVAELQRRIAVIDSPPPVEVEAPRRKTFRVYKRSLPVGTNKPVMWGLSQLDAAKAVHVLKTAVRDGIVFYYEAVEDGHPLETNIYWNEKL